MADRNLFIIDIQGRKIESLTCGRLVIDSQRWKMFWDGKEVRSTLAVVLAAYSLAKQPGLIQSHRTFLRNVARATTDNSNAAYVLIRNARRRFREVDPDFNQIETINGVGYRWRREV